MPSYRESYVSSKGVPKFIEVRRQLMRSNLCRSSTTSIYMPRVTDFDPKGIISELRVHVHAGANFGHSGY